MKKATPKRLKFYLTPEYVTISLTKLITLLLLILLMFNSVLPAMSTQSSSGFATHAALVIAQSGEIIFAVHLRVESLFTTSEIPENSPASRFVVFDPQTK